MQQDPFHAWWQAVAWTASGSAEAEPNVARSSTVDSPATTADTWTRNVGKVISVMGEKKKKQWAMKRVIECWKHVSWLRQSLLRSFGCLFLNLIHKKLCKEGGLVWGRGGGGGDNNRLRLFWVIFPDTNTYSAKPKFSAIVGQPKCVHELCAVGSLSILPCMCCTLMKTIDNSKPRRQPVPPPPPPPLSLSLSLSLSLFS